MKFSLFAAVFIVPLVSAHYFFNELIIDGVETEKFQYVRSNTRDKKYNPTKWENIRDNMTPDDLDFRCNKGAFTFAPQTETAEVRAGSKLAVKVAVDGVIQHPGPALVWMSKAPTTAQAYKGDSEWFKIFENSVCDKNGDFTKDAWCTWGKDRIEFTVPADLPDGEYLIRPEHVGIHGAHVGQAEFYYTCVQVRVVGGGSGTPGPTVKFPGAYKKDDPSFNFSIWGGCKEYPMPGPAVWTGGGSGDNATELVEQPTENSSTSSSPSSSTTLVAAPTTSVDPPKPNAGDGAPGKTCPHRRRPHARHARHHRH